jgi:membrane-associated protein
MLDVTQIVQSGGLLLIGLIIFAESGLLVGFFLPGDTLLFTAGFFAAQGELPLAGVLATIFIAAVIGDNVGYTIGQKTGPRLFKKKDGIIFKQENVTRAEAFYEKHGGKTIIIARFIPVVRTFAPMVAGVGNMTRQKFVLYNIVGAAIWTGTVVMAGYWLGSLVDPHTMEKYLLLAIVAAMSITLGPTIWHLLRDKRLRSFVGHQFKRVLSRLKYSKK